jgi:hypothetical protein
LTSDNYPEIAVECQVGRTPWSAADAHVGLLLVFVNACGSGSRGTRADQGVRPTNAVEDRGREESRPSRHECLRHRVLALSRLRHHFFHQFEELVGLDRLGNIAGHSGLDTFVAIAFHGMRRHRDDGS